MSNYPLVRGFIASKSTGNSSIIPFLATLLNCCFWFKYGILMGQNTIVFVNGVGITISLVCIYIFAKYTSKPETDFYIKVSTLFLYIVLLYAYFVNDPKVADQIGY